MPTPEAPFGGPSPNEVPLARAPLVQVLSQITFPQILSITKEETVAPFQERIRAQYPLTEKRIIQHIMVADGASTRSETIWRFWDAQKNWSVSLASTFIALQTRRYTSRKDFIARLTSLSAALQGTIDPKIVQRFGIRYVDRIEGAEFAELHGLVQSDFVFSPRSPFAAAASHVLTEAQFITEEGGQVLARWGTLPANETIDPEAVPPIAEPSFLLDLDMFSVEQRPFDSQAISSLADSYAQRLYTVFRSIVTDQFLSTYGGRT